MKKILFLTLLPLQALASSNISNNFSYIGFGYQSTNYSSTSLSPYFNGKYSNDEKKTLGGLYIDLNANIAKNIFIDGYADFSTRFSSNVDVWKTGLGYALYLSPQSSIPVSCGWKKYHSESDYASSYSEGSTYCKVGIKTQIANHWILDTSYQHEFLDEPKNTLGLKNVFQFGSVFGLVAGFKYAKRTESEVTYQLGLQFSFH
ncbi:outer membrane beta-barrel protein [Photobacterium chitinilyticum]|uniref:hypothetical protein n=1 Tax=Photobacterium chitinilyticum TaxID=2485123 RepID=UPI003D12255A